jgi:peroxiredoxin
VVHEWSQRLDPDGQLTFLSDGNLDLARNSGLAVTERSLFLGQCSKRFTLLLKNAIIEKIAVEDTINALTCTRPSTFL